MEQSLITALISFLKYILHSNIINFAVMVWLFVWVFKKFNLVSKLESSIEKVKDVIEKSDYDMHKSEAILSNAKKALDTVSDEISQIEKASLQRGKILKDRISESCENQIVRIKNNSKKAIEIEEHNFSSELTSFVVSSSISSAENKLINNLRQNPNLHEKYIDQSLHDFEKAVI